jgi:uncharacterized protein YgiM (DUF1202 family)
MEENTMNPQPASTNQDRPLRPGEVLIYSDENFQGQEQLIAEDTPVLNPDFAIASFRLGPKTGVTLFSEAKYGGRSQQMTAELSSLKDSRLQDQKAKSLPDQPDPKAKSLKIWLSAGKAFTGYWAIEAGAGRYLSVHQDTNGACILTTSPEVSDSEAFRIEDLGRVAHDRRKVSFESRAFSTGPSLVTPRGHPLTIAALQDVIMVDQSKKGPRNFSLMVGEKWIRYDPEEECFRTTDQSLDAMIFRKAIQLAEDENQVGELLQGDVALFENPSYWGKAWVLDKDLADFNCVSGLSNAVSSIQLGQLTGATIYTKAHYMADDTRMGKQDVVSNIPSLAQEQVDDNRIASLQTWQIKTPESLNLSFTCSLSQDYRSAENTFKEYSAYRTTLRLPPTVESVEVWTTDQTEIEVENKRYPVDEVKSVPLRPNPFHSLVITTDAIESPSNEDRKGSLKAPGLKIRTNTMQLDERIVIFPDRGVHERLANLKEDELWGAQYKDEHGTPISLRKGDQKREDVANAQSMVTKLMSTVKYSESATGGQTQSIDPEQLHGQSWALEFSTYRVHATTLYVREGPGIDHKPVGFLRKGDKVEALAFSQDGGWVKLRRSTDGLTGWSSRLYLDNIADRSLSGDRYQVTADTLYVREGPGIEYRAVGSVQRNEMVTAIGANDDGTWRQICRDDGMVGWSSASYLALVLPPLPSEDVTGVSFRVTGSLNVRKGPGVSFTTLGYLLIDDIVEALEANADGRWLRVRRTRDGLTGWASKRYLVRLVPAAPAPELPPAAVPARLGYGLAPETRFYETSKESVAELLAKAQSPDKDLAQSWPGDIWDLMKNAASIVVTGIEQGVAVIIKTVSDGVETAFNWIVDTAAKAAAFVEGILERIGMAIEEVIKWLRDVFDWDDILNTRDHLSKAILDALDSFATQVAPAMKGQVQQFFEAQKTSVVKGLNDAIIGLGGRPDAGGSTSPTSSGKGPAGLSDTLDWILSKVMSAGPGGLSFVSEASGAVSFSADFERFWANTVVQGLGTAVALPTGLGEVCTTLFDHPNEPLLALQKLLETLGDVVVDLLNLGETIAVGLLDFVEEMIEKIKKIITADIRLPFISDLMEWMGKGSVTFKLLDATTLILAIPVTAVYKTIFKEAPFKTGQALDPGVKLGLLIASGIGSLTSQAISGFLDGSKGDHPVLEFIVWIGNLVGLASQPIDWAESSDPASHDKLGERAWNLGFRMWDVIDFLVDGSALLKCGTNARRAEKKAAAQLSAMSFLSGAIREIVLIGKMIADGISKGIGAGAKVLLDIAAALPRPFAPLHDGGPQAILALVIIDIAAGLAGAASIGIAIDDLYHPDPQS